MTIESRLRRLGVEHTDPNLTLCSCCDNYHGTVEEENNGTVPVLCRCDLTQARKDQGHFPSPSMVSVDGKVVCWTPITEHLGADGCWWHTPHFAGPQLNSK